MSCIFFSSSLIFSFILVVSCPSASIIVSCISVFVFIVVLLLVLIRRILCILVQKLLCAIFRIVLLSFV